MAIYIALASILVIAAMAWLIRRFLSFGEGSAFGGKVNICPICAGVAGTWLWMFAGILTDQLPIASYQLPIAILMGGSVVGIAYQIEKKLPAERSPFLWKLIFIPAGFFAVYSALAIYWPLAAGIGITLAIFGLWLLRPTKPTGEEKRR